LELVVGHDAFGRRIAKGLGCEFREFREEYYPDGEPCPKILADYCELSDRDILVAARLRSPLNTLRILTYLHNLNRVVNSLTDSRLYNARNVDVLIPYFVLGRQDHNPKTDPEESVRIRDRGKDIGYLNIIVDMEARGVRRILTFTPHFDRSGEGSRTYREVGHGIEVYRLSGVNALARYFQDRAGPETMAVNPDMTAGKLASELAHLTGMVFGYGLEKKRVSDLEVEAKGRLDAEGKEVIIVDDIASSGATIMAAIRSIENHGGIVVAVIHPVLPDMPTPDKGYRLFKTLIAEGKIRDFVATDTIDSEFSKASTVEDVIGYYRSHR
jgi:phosphoribosylpyrophosphate synthetase